MARASVFFGKKKDQNLTISRSLLDCKMCTTEVRNGRMLPCQHTFCYTCIDMKRSSCSSQFKCPSCRRSFPIEDIQMPNLKPNILLDAILEQKRNVRRKRFFSLRSTQNNHQKTRFYSVKERPTANATPSPRTITKTEQNLKPISSDEETKYEVNEDCFLNTPRDLYYTSSEDSRYSDKGDSSSTGAYTDTEDSYYF